MKLLRPAITPPKGSTLLVARGAALAACACLFFPPPFAFLLMLVAFAALDIGCTKKNF
jgi:hypothetical protein